MVGPGYVLLAQQFGVSVDEVTSTFGAILLGLGTFMYASYPFRQRYETTENGLSGSVRTRSL